MPYFLLYLSPFVCILDPICVVSNVRKHWDLFQQTPHVMLALTASGSHLPFYSGIFFKNWAEDATFAFFDSVLSDLLLKK